MKDVDKLWGAMHNFDLYECSDICSCSEMCGHRMSPPVFSIKAALYKTESAGFAVECRQYIEQGTRRRYELLRVTCLGTFVAEFVGELVARTEQTKRTQDYAYQIFSKGGVGADRHSMFSIMLLQRSELFVDPTRFGNIARFFNHSCLPNLVPIRYYKNHRNSMRPSIGFVAWRDLVPGDELTIDYGEAWWQDRIDNIDNFYCQCGFKFCYYPAPGKAQTTRYVVGH